MRKALALACLFGAVTSVTAQAQEEQIFLFNKPQSCLAEIEAAMVKRSWSIDAKDEQSVTASIYGKGRSTAAEVHVFYRDNNFYYTSKAMKHVKKVVAGQWENNKFRTEIPANWVTNIQRDAAQLCPQLASDSNQPQQNVEERLQKLQALLAKGLITEAEYSQKRTEILQDI